MIINRKKIWSLSWPLIIANFTIPLVGLTDTIIMGHMPDSVYIAAIAIGGIIFNFMYAGLNFLRMGTTGIVAQNFGRHNFEEVFFSLLRPLIIAFTIGIILFLLKNYLYDLSIYFLTPNEQVQEFYKEYLFVRMIGLPAGLLNIVFLGWFFGMQKTKSVMLQLIAINIVNIIASLYLAVFLDYGIFGVALGSVIAQSSGLILSIIIFMYYYYKFNFRSYKLYKILDMGSFLNLFSISRHLFLRTMLLVAVQAYVIKKAGLIGVDQLATIEILLVIFSLSSYSLDAFAHSAESTVGVSIGSKNKLNILKDVSFDLALSGNSLKDTDYTIDQTSLSIPAGSLSASATVNVLPDGDTEGAETFVVELENLVNCVESVDQKLNININDVTNITKPYFTTKKQGTGLGLPIVSKIINDHGGEINFLKNSDGAKIVIKLPIYQ